MSLQRQNFIVVYFCNKNTFNLLEMSLRSWIWHSEYKEFIDSFYIYISKDLPLLPEQKKLLYDIGLPINIFTAKNETGSDNGSSLAFIENQSLAYTYLAEKYPDKWILKLDTDIIIYSLKIFKDFDEICTHQKIKTTNIGMIGAWNFSANRNYFIQGGAYFLNPLTVKQNFQFEKICKTNPVINSSEANDFYPEDKVFSRQSTLDDHFHLQLHYSSKQDLGYFSPFWPPPPIEDLLNTFKPYLDKLSFIHFIGKDKSEMQNYFNMLNNNFQRHEKENG
jgi:hypothetical protein